MSRINAEAISPGFFHDDPDAAGDFNAQRQGDASYFSPMNPGVPKLKTAPARARAKSMVEMIADYPNLALTGNVISATFSMPYSVKYNPGADWDLRPRRGQSALADAFAYLSSNDSSWNHRVVAWTGEIERPKPPAETKAAPTTTVGLPSLNTLSAAVPIESVWQKPGPPTSDGVVVPRSDQERLEQQLARTSGIKITPVWLADKPTAADKDVVLKDQSRWRKYGEHILYPLLHYKQHEPNDGRAELMQWKDYFRMNELFAAKIIEAYKPGDIVVIHDYYLMLLPGMLRKMAPHMYIAFFLHSPFPSSEFVRCLPTRREVLEGMLGSSVVGFQAYGYSRHFSSCCTRILGHPSDTRGVDYNGVRVEVATVPIGIDTGKVEKFAFSKPVEDKYEALKKMYEGKKIIVGRDRLDSARGVVQKLMAFERFLEKYPQWREKVVLIQVTSPTHLHDGGEAQTAMRVNELVLKINGRYGSLGFAPILHYSQYLAEDEYFALLRAGDIGLITSVRDGMNKTGLEYIVCQKDNNGLLILSEFSGTAASLGSAIRINPWDSGGVADAINDALSMSSADRAEIELSLYKHITHRDVRYWINHLLHRSVEVLSTSTTSVSTPLLDRELMLKCYNSAPKRLFMFDYDGTLTPIVREPSAAIPTTTVIDGLTKLSADPRNEVWIISGRDQKFLEKYLGHIPGLGFSAEHGSFMRYPGKSEWEDLTKQLDMSWREKVAETFQKYTDRVPGSFLESKNVAITWHYRLADPELGPHMAEDCRKHLVAEVASKWDVEVMPGKANLEVRPTLISKGEIAKRLVLNHTGGSTNSGVGNGGNKGHKGDDMGSNSNDNQAMLAPPSSLSSPATLSKLEFVLCVGDDTTDEDMFRALKSVPRMEPGCIFSITVGPSTKPTLASWHLTESAHVVECITTLNGDKAVKSETAGATSQTSGRTDGKEDVAKS